MRLWKKKKGQTPFIPSGESTGIHVMSKVRSRIWTTLGMLFSLHVGVQAGVETQASFSITDERSTVTDANTGLVWSRESKALEVNWNDAKLYCARKSPGNWELPTMSELQSLVGNTASVFLLTGDWFWSKESNGSSEAWGINLSDGTRRSVHASLDYSNSALCVRRGMPAPVTAAPASSTPAPVAKPAPAAPASVEYSAPPEPAPAPYEPPVEYSRPPPRNCYSNQFDITGRGESRSSQGFACDNAMYEARKQCRDIGSGNQTRFQPDSSCNCYQHGSQVFGYTHYCSYTGTCAVKPYGCN